MTDRSLANFIDRSSDVADVARSAVAVGPADPIEELLSNLPLTDDLIELLGPPLEDLRFPVKKVQNYSAWAYRPLDYHCVQVSGDQHIALIHGAEEVFKSSSCGVHVRCLGSIFSEFCHGLFVFFEVEKLGIYNILEKAWQRSFPLGAGIFGEVILNHWRGLKGDPIRLKHDVEIMLDLDKLSPRGAASGSLSNEDKKEIIRILAEQQHGYVSGSPQDFCKNLVERANLPDEFKRQISGAWSGNCEENARKLVDWALAKAGNPNDPQNTVLGTLLDELTIGPGADKDILNRIIGQQRSLARGS